MKKFNFILSLLFVYTLISCSYITGPEGFFPDTKNDFFDEKLSKDLVLPEDKNINIKNDDHYPPVGLSNKLVEVQNILSAGKSFLRVNPMKFNFEDWVSLCGSM